jgi:hypothetical protein
MIYPAEQQCELEAGLASGEMLLLPVATLSEAITALRDHSTITGDLVPCVG